MIKMQGNPTNALAILSQNRIRGILNLDEKIAFEIIRQCLRAVCTTAPALGADPARQEERQTGDRNEPANRHWGWEVTFDPIKHYAGFGRKTTSIGKSKQNFRLKHALFFVSFNDLSLSANFVFLICLLYFSLFYNFPVV